MKCQGRFVKFFAVLLIGLAGFQLSLTAMDKAVTHPELQTVGFKCLPHYPPAMPSEMIKNSFHAENSNPMQRIIQLILILFFISPPLIVVLLFLIWCELRKRNKPE